MFCGFLKELVTEGFNDRQKNKIKKELLINNLKIALKPININELSC